MGARFLLSEIGSGTPCLKDFPRGRPYPLATAQSTGSLPLFCSYRETLLFNGLFCPKEYFFLSLCCQVFLEIFHCTENPATGNIVLMRENILFCGRDSVRQQDIVTLPNSGLGMPLRFVKLNSRCLS